MVSAALIILAWNLGTQAPYTCGEEKIIKRPYGPVKLQVNCEYTKRTGRIVLVEYKGSVQHGFQMAYDTLWRKQDSSFFLDGKQEGLGLYWDTSGSVVGRETFHKGKHAGKEESYWSPGHPSIIKHYDKNGKEEGPWNEWWKNGNKKAEYIAKGGVIISGTEYYPNGQPRVRYVTKYEPKTKSVLKTKYIEAESWAPDGKPAGKITKGQGEWMIFQDGTEPKDTTVFLEKYKDSLMIEGHALTPDEAAKRLQ